MTIHDRLVTAVIVCLIALFASGCSGTDAADPDLGRAASPVVGGMLATYDQIYSAVALTKVADGSFACSATLIAPTVVVTAAHCIYKSDNTTEYAPSELYVVAGVLDTTSSAGQRYDITNMLPHPNYAYNNDTLGSANDIAVITLQQTVTSVSPVPTLPGTLFDSVLTTGTPVTIEGYGTHDSTNTTGQLYVASTPFQQRTKAEFLAGGSGSPDTCLGDSGGPVYVTAGGTMYTAGITSRQSDGSNCASASVYEVLNAFDTFLTANSKGAYPPTYPADGVPGSGTALAGCSCRVNNAPASSGLGLWMGFGVARIARRRRRA